MKPSTAAAEVADKMSVERIEVADLKEAPEKGDYAGAAAKTDPAEIKLVHKLDYRIMVSRLSLTWRLATNLVSPRSWSCTS